MIPIKSQGELNPQALNEAVLQHLKIEPIERYEYTGTELLETGETEMQFLLEGLIPKTSLSGFGGPSDTGKSSFLRQLAASISTGQEFFLGYKLNITYGSSIYVSTEDGINETKTLLKKQAKGFFNEQFHNLRFIFDTDSLLKKLDTSLQEKPADLIIIDGYADVYPGDLNNTSQIRPFLMGFQSLSRKYNCCIIFLHHTSKRSELRTPNKNNFIGGQGFEAKMRMVMELRIDLTKEDIRHLCIVKGNYISSKIKSKSIALRFDEDTLTFTSTGDGVPLSYLAKPDEFDTSKTKYFQAIHLKNSGSTHQEVANALGFGSKGTVSKLLEKAKEHGWDQDPEGDTTDLLQPIPVAPKAPKGRRRANLLPV